MCYITCSRNRENSSSYCLSPDLYETVS
uniref:Uncharacterized protein n=1 Tax=Rhizophora mucronata TaxID=61149 RepID=A0A2P2NMK5_RHIMU